VGVRHYDRDSTMKIGVVTGDYELGETAKVHQHRRRVGWEQIGLSRTIFSQAALYEVGSFLTVFRVREHAAEFLAAISQEAKSLEQTNEIVEKTAPDVEAEVIQEPRASRIERHTRDFVKETLYEDLTPRDFEEFIADLLKSLGYQARVTQYSQDGGIDVIAHRHLLGVEPP